LINKFSNLFYPHEYQEGNSSFCFPFICKNKNIANEMKKVFKKNQIEYRPIVSGNLLTQPFLLERSYKLETTKNISNVDILHDQGVYIGNSHFIGKKHMKLLLKSLEEVNENVG
jgi:CDP-6-deoxy-D-xylo-4-hexulose-3-dehydrase